MDLEAVAGSQELMLSATPAHSHQDTPSTRVAALVDQAFATDDQQYSASSITSDAGDVPSKAVLASPRPAMAPKQDSLRFLVTTHPAQFKDKDAMRENRKHVMADFLRKERRKTKKPNVREEATETEKPRRHDPHKQGAEKWKNLVVPARELHTVAPIPGWPNRRSAAWITRSTSEWTEKPGEAGKHRVAGKSMNLGARNHSPDGSAVLPGGSVNEAASLVPPNNQLDLFDAKTGTDSMKDTIPAIIPRLPSSTVPVGIGGIQARANHHNVKSHNTIQPKVSEGRTDQPVGNTTLTCQPLVEQNPATVKDLSVLPRLDRQTLSATPDPASQDRVRNNPFQRRLQQLVEYLASEGESSPDNISSTIDSDDASGRSDNSGDHSGYRYHDGVPNSDSPEFSHNAHSHTQHTIGSTSLTSCNQSNSPCAISGPNPTQGYGDNERVRTDTHQTQNGQQNGKVIPCPLRFQLKCAGMDDNMSSLL
jgi:hypothetical protein